MRTFHNDAAGAQRLCLKLLAVSAACLLSACASTTPQWDANFGNTVRTAFALQVLNPDASQNPDPVSGMDGRAARETIDRYQKSFKEPAPQPNIFTIGVGGGQ
ncbi:hypothetical protein [Herminiimonas sp. CN]|uniref:hypothetical protein n=1 Tax=Herminiimonas sp. CN TaxID=1349818 RepID=UPI0004737268|nr:hypothetical protein [Herminiimonas sp. CN]